MTDSIYAKAYTEVLTILKYLDPKEYSKIPTEEIELLQRNCDKGYNFELDKNKKLEEQNISKEANAVLIVLFQKYFANDQQNEKLKKILLQNYEKQEEKKRETYDTDVFKNRQQENKLEVLETTNNQVVKYNNNIVSKLLNKIKQFWYKIWQK